MSPVLKSACRRAAKRALELDACEAYAELVRAVFLTDQQGRSLPVRHRDQPGEQQRPVCRQQPAGLLPDLVSRDRQELAFVDGDLVPVDETGAKPGVQSACRFNLASSQSYSHRDDDSGAFCGSHPAFTCYAPEWAILNYLERQFGAHNYISIRNEYFNDMVGQPTGTKSRHTEHWFGWGHWMGDHGAVAS